MTTPQGSTPSAPVPVHVPERSCFEVDEPQGRAVLTYVLQPGPDRAVVLEHTLVPDALEGRGVGSALARSALAWAAQQDLTVVPRCAFVQAFLERHPDEVRVRLRAP